jgi:two-component system nitrate/nitrite response regulator NarL
VANGASVLSSSLQAGVFEQIRVRDQSALSLREQQLLELAASGARGEELAQRLGLSPHTVRTYWKRLYEKLGVADRASAIAEAIRRGLVQ